MDTVRSYACSFTGRRKNNEDSYIITEPVKGFFLYAVADGMGGANAGEIASSLAIEVISNFFRQELKPGREYSDGEIKEIIATGYKKVQSAIAGAIKEDPSFSGMGTTLVLLLKAGEKWFCGNIGDSRLYLVRDKELRLLTKDHTLLQQYIETQDKPPDDEWLNKYSNYLVRALDGGDSEPDIFVIPDTEELNKDFCFILCSDGVIFEKKPDFQPPLNEIVVPASDVRDAAEQIISYAYMNGSADNITVITVESAGFRHNPSSNVKRLPFPPNGPYDVKKPAQPNKKVVLILGSALLICISCLLYLVIKDSSKASQVAGNRIREPSPQPMVKGDFQQVEDDFQQAAPLPTRKGDFAVPQGDKEQKTVSAGNNTAVASLKWKAFSQEDYRLPVNGSSPLIWDPFNNSSAKVQSYKIKILLDDICIDSMEVKPNSNSVSFSDFKNLRPGKKHSAVISAILPGGQNAEGNMITFTYQ